jgi:hypothetical protein
MLCGLVAEKLGYDLQLMQKRSDPGTFIVLAELLHGGTEESYKMPYLRAQEYEAEVTHKYRL